MLHWAGGAHLAGAPGRKPRADTIESLLHTTQLRTAEIGSRDWLLAVVGAIAARPPLPAGPGLTLSERRDVLEERLRQSGLAYGTAGSDLEVEVPDGAGPGLRSFAQLVAGFVRTCARVGWLSGSRAFVQGEGGLSPAEALQTRRAQLVALLGAMAGDAKVAAHLFAHPLEDSNLVARLVTKAATHLPRRYLDQGGAFLGLPLHNAFCAIEVRTLATLSLSAFEHGRLSPVAARLLERAAVSWRAIVVELFSGLSAQQEQGLHSRRGFEQVIRRQRLPAREARLLRAALDDPRPPRELAAALASPALQRFALEQVLLLALADEKLEPGEVAFLDELSGALGTGPEELARMEVEVLDFYRSHTEALAALRRAEVPEGLPTMLTRRIQASVEDNLDRLLQEIRETGELAELLTKATRGATLSAAEKAKVRQQLLDLAKAIPALAVFAAPGGALLLPILLKLLPFNILPSSFAVEKPRLRLPQRTERTGK